MKTTFTLPDPDTDKEQYEIGDTVFFANGREKLTEGKVVHKFKLEEYYCLLYVIQVETPIDPYFEVRDWQTLSSAADRDLNMWERIKAYRNG